MAEQNDTVTLPSMYEGLDPIRVMSHILMLPYQVIADISFGEQGHFTIPFGKYVFSGKVYALNNQQGPLDSIQEELKRLNLSNVETKVITDEKLPLEDNILDGAFSALTLHEVKDLKGLLGELKRSMKKGAWLALIEWHKRKTDNGPAVKDRLGEDKLLEIATDIGLRLTSRRDLNDQQYMVLLRKAPDD